MSTAEPPGRGRPRPPDAGPAGARRRAVDGARRPTFTLLLRPADRQAVPVGGRHPGVPLHRAGWRPAPSLLAAGADLTGRPALRRTGRLGALRRSALSMAALVHDLGRPARFLNMLRVAKLTSPMSVGTWILTAYGPFAGVAAVAELRRAAPGRLRAVAAAARGRRLGRPAGLAAAAVIAPPVAAYTAVLLADTATPSWHEAYRELPFVFGGSRRGRRGRPRHVGAAVDAGRPGPAVRGRRRRAGAAPSEHRMEQSMGLHRRAAAPGQGRAADAGRQALTAAGAAGAAGRPQPGGRRRSPARRCWPARCAPGSASSRPGRSPPATRSTPWSRSANGSTRTDPPVATP